MIEPLMRDDDFLVTTAMARSRPAMDRLDLWWLGQSGFLAAWAGDFLLFDPYLSDSLTRKYAGTDQPHVRMTARVVDPARLDFITVVTSSHNHTDHLDAETLRPLLTASPKARLAVPAANVEFVEERLGAEFANRLVPMTEGYREVFGRWSLLAVPAAHEELSPQYMGIVANAGPFAIYHSGDTVRFPGMVERLREHAIDLALLPINGRSPERRVAGNLDGREAAQLARDIGARCAVPCHYDMFTFNTASPDEFSAECARLRQRGIVLRLGEQLTVGRA
jgi:L-ascorbate metabolism protein UlaG (beta-lactamase superfamily)